MAGMGTKEEWMNSWKLQNILGGELLTIICGPAVLRKKQTILLVKLIYQMFYIL